MINQTLISHISEEVEIVIITPILSAFKKLIDRLGCSEVVDCCFFHNAHFETQNGTKGIIIIIPQGIGAQDVMYALSDKDILFYGYAGSLTCKIPIGSIVEVNLALFVSEYDSGRYEVNTIGKNSNVVCGYSPCLLGDLASKHCENSRQAGCQVIDMETVFCARAALINNNRFYSNLVISDIPSTINFWELSDDLRVYFKRQCAEAIDNIVLYAKSYSKGD